MNPVSEAYLRGIMPGLSDRQYDLRSTLMVARDFANKQIAEGIDGLHEWQLFYFVSDAVNGWIMAPMSDDELEERVSYCRRLAKLAVEAGRLFNAK